MSNTTKAFREERSWRSALLPFLLLICVSAGAHPGALDAQGCHWDAAKKARHCHQQAAGDASRALQRSTVPKAGEEGILDGRLLWVTDGDSLRVLVKGRDMEVRLADIDAPERDQPHGWESKLQLIDLVRGKHIVFAPLDVDGYGRIVARVWAGEIDVNRELVKRGAAWFYPEYARDEELYLEEQRARDAKLGLWALPLEQRQEPWTWRRQGREASERKRRK